jgi:hypothetical protein
MPRIDVADEDVCTTVLELRNYKGEVKFLKICQLTENYWGGGRDNDGHTHTMIS